MGRQVVGDLVPLNGKESVFDLSGMNRSNGIAAADVPHLTSHIPSLRAPHGRGSGAPRRPHPESRLGVDRIVAAIERGIERLGVVIDDVPAARKQLLGI